MYILGAGHYHPENVISNAFLESLDIGTNREWIMERVGIGERRTVLPLEYIRETRNRDPRAAREAAKYTAAELGEKAARMAMERAGVQPNEIGLVIASASLPERCIPAHACLIAARLGIEAPAFDLNAACSSFLAQLHFVREETVLLVQTETYTMATDYSDRTTAVLWGDGASAQVLAKRGKLRIVETLFGSRPSEAERVRIPYGGFFTQDGNRVQRFAIMQTEATFNALRKKGASPRFIGHQANLRMLESSTKRLGISEDRHHFNVDRFGNCGAVGAPSVLSERWEQFCPGDSLTMVTVGAGLSWGGAVLNYEI